MGMGWAQLLHDRGGLRLRQGDQQSTGRLRVEEHVLMDLVAVLPVEDIGNILAVRPRAAGEILPSHNFSTI